MDWAAELLVVDGLHAPRHRGRVTIEMRRTRVDGSLRRRLLLAH
jgi:hypothetical protein